MWARLDAPAGRRGGALIVIAIGAGETLLATAFFLYVAGALDVVLPARTVEIGPGRALLGYLCALVGALWLPPARDGWSADPLGHGAMWDARRSASRRHAHLMLWRWGYLARHVRGARRVDRQERRRGRKWNDICFQNGALS